jgi:hypothetical protein
LEADEQVFTAREEAIRVIDDALPNLPADLRADVCIRAMSVFEEISRPQRSVSFGLVVRRWVIRKSDLSVLRSVSDAAIAAGSAGLPEVGTMRATLIGAIVATVRALRGIYAKGTTLATDAVGVLLAVKAHDGLTTSELLAHLVRDPPWSEDELAHVLESLQAVPLQDRTVVPLVQRDGEYRWHSLA